MSLKKQFDEINAQISREVRWFRRSNEFNQVEFAKQLGVSQPHLSKIENGLAALSAAQYFVFKQIVERTKAK